VPKKHLQFDDIDIESMLPALPNLDEMVII